MQDSSEGSPISSVPASPRRDGSLAWRLAGVLLTVRPHQWVKNVFVLAPVVFAKEIFSVGLLTHAAFAVLCMLAGSIYTINDLADVAADRVHPVKRFRPIASGQVPLPWARALAVSLVIVSLAWAMTFSFGFFLVAAGYLALNLAYSAKLKRMAYHDVACISAGLQRAALQAYSRRGLDWALGLTAVTTIVSYLRYALDSRTRAFFHTDALWISTLFVVLGVGRFLQLVSSRPKAESPTQEMLRDGPFVAILLLWVGLVRWVVYLRPGAV